MGVSWILELFDGRGLFVYVLLNTYNLLSGAAIFFLFVFKKNILVKLCMRFNIDNEWVRSYEPSMRSKSGTNKSSRFSKSKKNSEMKEVEMASMTNYTSNDENTAA
uniref:Uncharacterized protein n=1 Tax=Heliothis virescens TaxID=7102 RepID=A0A2A4ITP9_HELVI